MDPNRASSKMKVTWYSYRTIKSTLVIGSTVPPSSRKIPTSKLVEWDIQRNGSGMLLYFCLLGCKELLSSMLAT